jgi:hypothetical protein
VWNVELVNKTFTALEAEEILKIKPGVSLSHDVTAWAFEKNGFYSVRSAYRLLKESQMADAMASSSEAGASGDGRAWSLLWKLDAPPKVRVFWWRVLHDALPSKVKLKRRHVAKESFYEVCGDPEESVYHVIWQCPVAKCFWAEIKRVLGHVVPDFHPNSWATDVFCLEVCPPKIVAVVVCGAWSLWSGRNARRHGRQVWEPGAAVRYISKLLEEMAMLKTPARPGQPRMAMKWKKPEEGWCKVNTDAAFDTVSGTGSAGVVIRDEQGQ